VVDCLQNTAIIDYIGSLRTLLDRREHIQPNAMFDEGYITIDAGAVSAQPSSRIHAHDTRIVCVVKRMNDLSISVPDPCCSVVPFLSSELNMKE
jgi:hypothetical protein